MALEHQLRVRQVETVLRIRKGLRGTVSIGGLIQRASFTGRGVGVSRLHKA